MAPGRSLNDAGSGSGWRGAGRAGTPATLPGVPEQILVIGGVAAGMSAASRARRLAPAAAITVVERGPVAAYGACGLPHVLAGEIAIEDLIALPVATAREQRRIDVRLETEAIAIEPGRHRVRVRTGAAEQWLRYDRLVLATGAGPRWQPPPLRNIFGVQSWVDVVALQAALKSERPRRAVVVGAGYIGLEVAAALAARGLRVSVVDAHTLPLGRFEPTIAERLLAPMAAGGIEFRPGTRVTAATGATGGRVLGLETSTGAIEADLVLNCAGLRPQTTIAQAAGIALGSTGAIAVDDRQQTNVPGILAAGDCAETRDLVTGRPAWVPLGAPANKTGRVAGQNAAGARAARFPGGLGTLAVTLFGCDIGRTGLTLEQARGAGFDAAAVTVETSAQAGYLKRGGGTLRLTMVHQPSTGRLLGVHLMGPLGTVAGRLDAAAVALTARLTLESLETLDLAYAPTLAPLYEPLLIAAHNAMR